MTDIRIGIGYDIHRIGEGKFLTIGGVKVPFKGGFIAHSDGDVLIHAVIDAILGALNLRDIGERFPDNDPKYKGIDSTLLLKNVYDQMLSMHYQIMNLDCIIIAQKPKLSSYKDDIKNSLSNILHTPNISIKAKTNERVGDIGQEKAVASICTVLLTTTA